MQINLVEYREKFASLLLDAINSGDAMSEATLAFVAYARRLAGLQSSMSLRPQFAEGGASFTTVKPTQAVIDGVALKHVLAEAKALPSEASVEREIAKREQQLAAAENELNAAAEKYRTARAAYIHSKAQRELRRQVWNEIYMMFERFVHTTETHTIYRAMLPPEAEAWFKRFDGEARAGRAAEPPARESQVPAAVTSLVLRDGELATIPARVQELRRVLRG